MAAAKDAKPTRDLESEIDDLKAALKDLKSEIADLKRHSGHGYD